MTYTSESTRNWMILWWVALALTIVLASLVTSYRNIFGPYLSPVAWTLSGMLFCAISWKLVQDGKAITQKNNDRSWLDQLPWGIFLLGVGITGWKFSTIIPQYPIDPSISDVIPALQQYVSRFVAGEAVYEPMNMGSWTIYPNYLPLRWMVFVPAEWLGMDLRWWAQLVFYASLIPWYAWLVRSGRTPLLKNILATIPMLCLVLLLWGDPPFWGMVVEQMYVALYLLLAYGLLRRSAVLIGLGILFCVLSRFSLSFWVPAFLIAYLLKEGWAKSFLLGGVIFTGILVFFVFPFLSRDWNMFNKSMNYYDTAILDQWKVQHWQEPDDVPFYMNNGLSFTYYFFSIPDGDERARLDKAKFWHLMASVSAALVLLVLYFGLGKWKESWSEFWLIGLAFFLVLFYSFMYMPFPYLYLIPVLLCSVITFVLPDIKRAA